MKLTQSLKKRISSLHQKKYRDTYNEYIIEGFKMIEEAFEANQQVAFIVINESVINDRRARKISSLAEKGSAGMYHVDEKEFDKLSSLETPPGILAIIEKKGEFVEENRPLLILDAIKDPGNLGTIIRTADWFGLDNVVIGKGSVDVYNSKVLQATMGSVFHVNFIQDQDVLTLIRELKKKGYTIIATSLEGVEDEPVIQENRFAVIMGSEASGVKRDVLELVDHAYRIPGRGKAESLNVAVAAGIILSKVSSK